MSKAKKISERVNRDIRYDKFLIIESWAFKGRHYAEKNDEPKMLDAIKRINKELRELNALLKFDPDGEL